jgi:hypothetical protein
VNELREDLDRALRTVTFSEAPVEGAKRRGRRIRARRRLAVLAGALVVAAIAAGYPALARSSAAPPGLASGLPTQAPDKSPASHDPVLTEGPGGTIHAAGGLTDKTGIVAWGLVGKMKWQVTVQGPGAANPVPADSCYVAATSAASPLGQSCNDIPVQLASGLTRNGAPAAFTGLSEGTTEVTIGAAAPDVTFSVVTFTDGQQLKLIPVTTGGHRYITWVAPVSMAVASVVAHLGGPYSDSGLTAVAVPFDQPGRFPIFGLWQQAGQAAPPRDALIIVGTTGGHHWQSTAFEGPWGTCFVTSSGTTACVPVKRLTTTAIIGGWGGDSPGPAFGSAAPGVALVRVMLSNGKTALVKPVGVGNEDVFAFATGKGVSPVSWTAYGKSGHQVAAGSAKTGLVVNAAQL